MELQFNTFIELFNQASTELNYKTYSLISRKLSESDYFLAYLNFIHNSFHYCRYSMIVSNNMTINNVLIKGKYLNEKVNKWARVGIFSKMYDICRTKYKKISDKSKHFYIDGHVTTNKYGHVKQLGRCIQYKSKYGLNLQFIDDDNGIASGMSIHKGSESENRLLVDCLNNSGIHNTRKGKKYQIADAGYDSKLNHDHIRSKGYTPIIWKNRRNIKDEEKLKKLKLTKKEKKEYKKRHIVENSFSWIKTKVPRLEKIYDSYINNYLNMVYLAVSSLILSKVCLIK